MAIASGGPTPISLMLKPDVAAPGVAIISSLPVSQGGPYGALSGTSMATPQVSGAVALLKQRHPSWTVEEIKSALVQTLPFAVPAYMRSEPSIGSSTVMRMLIDCDVLPVTLPEMSVHAYALPLSPVAERYRAVHAIMRCWPRLPGLLPPRGP